MGRRNRGKRTNGVAKNTKDIKTLKQMVKTSNKIFDKTIISVVTDSATVVNLSDISQGDDQDNREGNRIRLLHLLMRYSVQSNAASNVSALRVMILIDNEQDGVLPTPTQVLQVAGDYLSPLNRTSFGRFKVLYDRVHNVNIGTNNEFINAKVFKKLNKNCFYEAASGADTSSRKGNIYLMLLSNEPTNGPTFDAAWRFAFNG